MYFAGRLRKLYTVEQQAKEDGLDTIALKERRQQHSKPILDEICHRLKDWSIEVLPKSPVGQAVGAAIQNIQISHQF